MKPLAAVAVSSVGGATTLVVVFGLLSFVFPPLGLVSGGLLCLVVLSHGLQRAITVMVFSAAALLLVAYLLLPQADTDEASWPGMLFLLGIQWLPLLFASEWMRRVNSLSFAGQALAALGLFMVLLVAWFVPERAALWGVLLDDRAGELLQELFAADPKIRDVYELVLQQMTGIAFFSLATLIWIPALMLGRWWQSQLFSPGSFSSEYAHFRMGKVASVLLVVFLLLASLNDNLLINELLLVLVPFFIFQFAAALYYFAKGRLQVSRLQVFFCTAFFFWRYSWRRSCLRLCSVSWAPLMACSASAPG